MTNRNRLITALLVIALAVVSFLPLGSLASRPETFAAVAASIDEKTETVLKLTATSTIASAAISAIPDDTATPIAEKLADFTEYFLLILCTLYAEKYLLTIIGLGTFRILIPLGCLLFLAGFFRRNAALKRLAFRLAVFGLTLFLTIPTSIQVSDMIFDTYRESIDATITTAEEFAAEDTAAETESGFLSSVWSKVTDLPGTVSSLTNRAASVMNNFIESLAVMIVTSCVIPLLVLLFFVWLMRLLTGADLFHAFGHHRHHIEMEETEGAAR